MTLKERNLLKSHLNTIILDCDKIQGNSHEVFKIKNTCNSFLNFLDLYCKTITSANLETTNEQLSNLTNVEAFKFGAEVMLDKILDFLNFNVIGITTLKRESRSEFIERLSKEM